MLRIAICDDVPCFSQQTKDFLLQWPQKPDQLQIDIFSDGDALLTAHTAFPYDIILLDVIMPLCSGIDTAKEIRQQDKSVKLVFITSSSDFAVDSYTVKASNYILKPLEPQKLYQSISDLYEQICEAAKSIIVKSAKAIHRVEIRSIEYIEAQNKHVLFVLTNGQTILSTEPLYRYEDLLLLSDGFFKCSRSYIVNIAHIDTYTTKEIKTRSGCRISISRSCHKEFEAAYFEILFGKAGDR